ncbi:hypothetical protein ACQCSX_07635 [Pseudarthrobacter sp. P1]|uniref:hypothetical protein n=1 Tax=Pseudarthrobacter sp. P1 TaxID=3418418 RepID=UPI003CF9FA00
MLARAGLPVFIPDYGLEDEHGIAQLWVDLGCPAFKVCAEYEGSHHLTPAKQAEDKTRDRLTADLGWRQVKIYAADMRFGDAWVVQQFIQALRAHGWTGR